MVAVGVGDEDVAHYTSRHRRQQGGEMRLVQRAGVDHRHLRPRLGPTDDIGPRPREGEGTRIVGDHSLNQRRDLIAPPVGEIKIPNEGNHADAPSSGATLALTPR